MKVFWRVLLKLFILLLVAAAAAAGAIGWHAYQQSTPGYIIDQYLACLIDNDDEKAFELLDQSEETAMTQEEYAEALKGKRYSLSSGYTVSELQQRVDNNGNEYADFHAEFKNAEDEVQFEDDFVVKKQADTAFGIFDRWKVLSGHCMVKNLKITVPTGSQVYLDNAPLDPAWIVRDGVPYSMDCYQIPALVPGRKSLVIRHSELEALNTTLDTNDGDQDYVSQMTLKRAAGEECMTIGISALKQFYAVSVNDKTADLEELFKACLEEVSQAVKDQKNAFEEDNSVFQGLGVSEFAPQYGAPAFAEGEDKVITVEMTLGYHYVMRKDVTSDTGDVYDDGTPIQQTERVTESGDASAKFVMAYQDGAWIISHAEIPVIPAEGTQSPAQGETQSGGAADGEQSGTEDGTSGDIQEDQSQSDAA